MRDTPDISIIIPVLNDAYALQRCLTALRGAPGLDCAETIVVDGGSGDDPQVPARDAGAQFVAAERGRGRQMNAGARVARGKWLWFLHADCVAHPDSLRAILELDSATQWGCFRHRIGARELGYRVIERADNLRARFLRLPYGDQGIFVRRKLFDSLSGYAETPSLEDVMLARALAKRFAPRMLRPMLVCDARRWEQLGVCRTTWRNWRIMWNYFRGGHIEKNY